MKTTHLLFLALVLLLTATATEAQSSTKQQTIEVVDHPLQEMAVLELPTGSSSQWREVSRSVTETEGIIEFIPIDQQISTWSECVHIQFQDKSLLKERAQIAIDKFVEILRSEAIAAHQEDKITWRIIESTPSMIIYELILHKSHNGVLPVHQIFRVSLTENGLHRIGFSRRGKEMDQAERNVWIKNLRESISIGTVEEAKKKSEGLSMIDRLKDSLDLGPEFKVWKEVTHYTLNNGFTVIDRVPPKSKGKETECLTIFTAHAPNSPTIDKLFDLEKSRLQKDVSQKIEFCVLKQTSSEIAFSFSKPVVDKPLQMTHIVRMFLSQQRYYFINFKIVQRDPLKKEEILKCLKRLEPIKIRDYSNLKSRYGSSSR